MPNHSKNVSVEIVTGDGILVGTALVPLNKFKNLTNLFPEWINIYGPP